MVNRIPRPYKRFSRFFLHIKIRTLFEIIWEFKFFGILFLSALSLVAWPLSVSLSLLADTPFEVFGSSKSNLSLHLRV